MKAGHKAIGAAGILGIMLMGFEVWGHIREEVERVKHQAEWRTQVEDRLCKLEGGRIWRGDCVHRRRRR